MVIYSPLLLSSHDHLEMSVVVILEGLGKRKRAGSGSVAIPSALVAGSILERVCPDDSGRLSLFPLPRNAGVPIRALHDSVNVHKLLQLEPHGRTRAIALMRFWRRRMGELIRCSTYMGFSTVQDVCDESMRSRMAIDAWNTELRNIFLHHSFTVDKVLDFFVGRLDYERIHSEQLSSWVSTTVVDKWWGGLYLNQRPDFYRRATAHLNWKPRSESWCGGALIFLSNFGYAVRARCELLKLLMADGVVLIDKGSSVQPRDMRTILRFLLLISKDQADAAISKIAADPTEMLLPKTAGGVRRLARQSWRAIVADGGFENDMLQGEVVVEHLSDRALEVLGALADAFNIPRRVFMGVYSFAL
jgi:hypothetical protein